MDHSDQIIGVEAPRHGPSDLGGKCERGGTPLSQNDNVQSELAEVRVSARGSFDSRARRGWKPGSPAPTPPAPGPACGSRRTCGTPARSAWADRERGLPAHPNWRIKTRTVWWPRSRSAQTWCRRRDSNPHDHKDRGILSPVRLPIPPLRQTPKPSPHRRSESQCTNEGSRFLDIPMTAKTRPPTAGGRAKSQECQRSRRFRGVV